MHTLIGHRVGRWSASIRILALLIASLRMGAVQGQYGELVGAWKVSYGAANSTQLFMGAHSVHAVELTIYDVDLARAGTRDFFFECRTADAAVTTVQSSRIEKRDLLVSEANIGRWHGVALLAGHSLGCTQLYVTLQPSTMQFVEESQQRLNVTALREERVNDRLFTYTAAALVVFMFINLGTVLDLQRLKRILIRPVGVVIAFACRYIIMPALGLAMGYIFFRGSKELQLALFFTALAPSGGLANICNVFLKGNINLSIATTTINSLLALAMLPLWLHALGTVVYDESELAVPFVSLVVGSVGLVAAIAVGVVLRTCIPKTTRFIFKWLKPLSLLLSLGLIALTVAINAFIFRELTLMVCLVAFCLPITAYLVSFGLSKIFCRSSTDALTIGVETSVLNMTVPIVLVQYSFDNPQADMMMAVPIMSALMSLALVVVFYIVRRIFGWNTKLDADAFNEKEFMTDN